MYFLLKHRLLQICFLISIITGQKAAVAAGMFSDGSGSDPFRDFPDQMFHTCKWLFDDLDRSAQHVASKAAYVDRLKAQGLHSQASAVENQIKFATDFSDTVVNMGLGAIKSTIDEAQAQRKQEREIEEYRQKTEINSENMRKEIQARGEQYRENIRVWMDNAKNILSDKTVMYRVGGLAVGIIGGYFVLKHGSRLIAQYIESIIGQPNLIQETSVKPLSARMLNLIFANKEPRLSANDIVLPVGLKREFLDIVKMVSLNRKYQGEYSHLMFYGPPGTGKTLSAKIISQMSGMDYAIIAGSAFTQYGEGKDIQELDKLIRWAKGSKKGLVLFIDEADSALGARNSKSLRSDHLVNFFLSNFSEKSHEKIMLVLATNHPEKIDQAILSRISRQIYIGLPGLPERSKQLELAARKIFHDGKSTRKKYLKKQVEIVPSDALQKGYHSIAEMTEGFTGRDIYDLILQFRNAALLSGSNEVSLQLAIEITRQAGKVVENRAKMQQQGQGHHYFSPSQGRDG